MLALVPGWEDQYHVDGWVEEAFTFQHRRLLGI